MHAFGPSYAYFLLHGSAGELKPWPIEIVAKAIGSGHPYQHGRGIGHCLEPSLAFPQAFVSTLALCDIAVYRVIQDVLAGSRSHRNSEKRHINHSPIHASSNLFDLNPATLLQQARECSGAPNLSFRNDKIIDRTLQHFVGSITEHACEFLVDANDEVICS